MFCYLPNSQHYCKKQSNTGGTCPSRSVLHLSPLSPPCCLLWVEHSVLQLREELDKNIPTEKPWGFLWNSGTEQVEDTGDGQQEAGAGNRTVSSRSGQWLDQIKVRCETAPQRQRAHTQTTPQSCHPHTPNGYAKFRPRKKWLVTLSNAFLLKGSIRVTNNSAIPNANEERDSNRA